MIVLSKLPGVIWYMTNIVINYMINKGIDRIMGSRSKVSRKVSIGNAIPDIYGKHLLTALVHEHNLWRQDLNDIFESEAECYAVLSGESLLSLIHIE